MHSRIRDLALIVVVLLAAACSQSQTGTSPSSPSTSPSAAPTQSTLKAPIAGLLDRNGPPDPSFAAVIGGFVVNVHWADLQPTPGAAIPANNAIDQAIASVNALDSSGRMGLRVRVFAGIYAPDWAKSLGGAAMSVVDPTTGQSGTIGRFWSADFGAAYQDLEAKLAARYDKVPQVREVTISRCTTVFAEPFIRDVADPNTVSALLGAGFTQAADQACQRDQIVAHRVWLYTRSNLSFNPYQVIGRARGDETFTEQMMDYCRATLGPRCVLANNSLRTPLQFPQMYARMQALGPPITFQTAVLSKVGDLARTLQTAASLGAASVELPAGFQSVLSVSDMAGFDRILAANLASA